MQIAVEGVKIILTQEQVALIEKERKRLKRACGSFDKVLKHFGFKRIKDIKDQCYGNVLTGWYAEIIDRGNWMEVWMRGKGLKEDQAFPGGHMYGEPQELKSELLKASGNYEATN